MKNLHTKNLRATKARIFFSGFSSGLILISLLVGLAGCGGSKNSENKAKEAAATKPIAVAEVAGMATAQSGGVEVRSGAEVLLSGQNSKAVNKPLLYYYWEQTDNSGYKVDLYDRSTNSVGFTAPQIPLSNSQGVTLDFQLTVVDADGGEAATKVSVLVKPIKDQNQFLTVTGQAGKILAYVTGSVNDVIATDIPVTLTVISEASWMGRDGAQHSLVVDTQNLTGTVPAGTVTAVNNSSNLYFPIQLPQINADQINSHFKGALRAGRLEFEEAANAKLKMNFSLAQTGGNPLSVYLANAAGDTLFDVTRLSQKTLLPQVIQQKPVLVGTITSASVDVEEIRQAIGIESKLSATNYYNCLDPSNTSQTFSGWLKRAGFTGSGDGDVATQYINNYDLGFGRDMHIREDANGNVFSYVTNYSSLENTLSHRNEFAIVAMEYSPAPAGNCGDVAQANLPASKKIVKFFAFVPDQKNGGYIRSESMNFDGRGEKFLPGVCTACHGANNNIAAFNSKTVIDAAKADLNSEFLPWDLDAFLYTQAADSKLIDPSYSRYATANKLAADVVAKKGREAQENLFKQQNQIALHTYTENTANIPRFANVIKQMHGWYGSATDIAAVEALDFGTAALPPSQANLDLLKIKLKQLPAGNFNGATYIPKGWSANDSQKALYKDVFARNCRMCHLGTANPKYDFDNYDELVTDTKLRSLVYEQGIMPVSRLTMDRFWINFYGGESAASKLRAHLSSDGIATNDVPLNASPGMPIANIVPDANDKAVADVILDVGQTQIFDSTYSLFATNVAWSLNSNAVSQAKKYLFTATTPGATDTVSLVVSNAEATSENKSRKILTNNYTPVISNLPTLTLFEGETKTFDLFAALCPSTNADAKACRNVYGDIKAGQQPTINISNVVRGQVSVVSVDAQHAIIQYKSTLAAAQGDVSFDISITDSYGETSAVVTVPVAVSSYPAPTIGTPDICTVIALSSNNTNCVNPALNDTAAIPSLSVSMVGVDAVSEQGGSVSFVNGVIHYTPPAFFVGTDHYNYTVIDNSLSQKTSQGTVTITVVPAGVYANIQGFVPSPLTSVNEGRAVTLNLYSALCPGGAPDSVACQNVFGIISAGGHPTITLVGTPVRGSVIFNSTTGSITFTSTAAKAAGNGSFAFKLTDSFGEDSTVATATIVINQFAAPTATAAACTSSAINSGNNGTSGANIFPRSLDTGACTTAPQASPAVGSGLSASIVSVTSPSSQGGTVSLLLPSGVIRYTPPRFFAGGTDSFSYTVQDNSLSGRTAVSSVVVTVNPTSTSTYTALQTNFALSMGAGGCSFNNACHGNSAPQPNWQTYTTIQSIGLVIGNPTSTPLVLNQNTTVTNILSSWLFVNACDATWHSGGVRLCTTTTLNGATPAVSDLNAFGLKILYWIEEGARNN